MAVQVFQPFEIFYDINGKPVDDGFIFIGQPNLDPITNPISVFFDEALTIPAAQPIRTRNGFPDNAGVQAQVFVAETTFSISIKNKNSTVIRSVSAVHSASDLEGRLRDAVNPLNGAGIVGVDPALSYQAGSVGAELHAEYARREGKNVMFLGGVLRRVDASSSWNFIIDAGHRPLNGLSVSVTGAGDIRVTFPTASKIIGFVCGPDETFTEMGIIAGASVGFSTADIRMSADMRGLLEMESQTLSGIPYWWGNKITATPLPGVGVRLDHPVAISGTPIVCPASSGFPADVSVGPSVSGDFTNLYPIAELGALIQRTGGGAVTVNSVHNGITTASIGGGVLRITHPTVPAASWPVITPRLNNGALIPVLGSAGATFLDVSFRDYAGTAITTLPADFDFTWMRPTPVPMNVVTGSGFTAFNLGRGKVNANDLYHATGNIWFVGLIEPA